MRTCCIILILLITAGYKPKAQTYTRNTNETAEAFVKRIYNVEELAHPVIETREWDSLRKVIICFRNVDVRSGDKRVVGNILVPIKGDIYKQILIDSFYYVEGGISERTVETVFFANADKDKPREMFVQLRARANPPRYADWHHYGNYYDTYVYDNPNMQDLPDQLFLFESLTKKFSDEFEGEVYEVKNFKTGDEKLIEKSKAKYKTVDAVRKALKQMGY